MDTDYPETNAPWLPHEELRHVRDIAARMVADYVVAGLPQHQRTLDRFRLADEECTRVNIEHSAYWRRREMAGAA